MWSSEKGEEEPDWVKTERIQFTEHRDLNKDGKLDPAEVGQWILPSDQNHVTTETNHLMEQTDMNKVLVSHRYPCFTLHFRMAF